jgi:hypothetical protein
VLAICSCWHRTIVCEDFANPHEESAHHSGKEKPMSVGSGDRTRVGVGPQRVDLSGCTPGLSGAIDHHQSIWRAKCFGATKQVPGAPLKLPPQLSRFATGHAASVRRDDGTFNIGAREALQSRLAHGVQRRLLCVMYSTGALQNVNDE